MKKKIKLRRVLLSLLIAFALVLCIKYKNEQLVFSKKSGDILQLEADRTVGEKAYITGMEIIDRITGTGPWDNNNNAGNDQDEDNNIVRSFDSVVWKIKCNINLKEGYQNEIVTGGTIQVKATVPESVAQYVEWNPSKTTARENVEISEDGTTYTAQLTRANDATVIGNQQLNFALDVLGAPNGLELKPTFEVSVIGNGESEKRSITPDQTAEDNDVTSVVIVSAAPKINMSIVRSKNDYRYKFDLDSGNSVDDTSETGVDGRVQIYGLVLQLYNDSEEKGLKGVAVPTGEITFDLTLNVSRNA